MVSSPTLDPAAIGEALRLSGADLAPGLTEAELDGLKDEWSLDLAPDHRLMLSIALPLGDKGRWPDWRSGDREKLRSQVLSPVQGVLFDVAQNAFWHPAWPERPADMGQALQLASSELEAAPKLAPLYGHRYLPTVPPQAGNPVLSCVQTDIIYYGRDLLDWFKREFLVAPVPPMGAIQQPPPFWDWFV
jgi:hypothetical protein